MYSSSFKTCALLGISVLLVALLSGCPGEGDPDPVDPSVVPTGDMSMAIGDPTKSLTNSGPVSYKVTYTGAKSVTLSDDDVTLETTGTASGEVSVIGSGISSRTVTVSNITGDGSLAIAIKEGTASDGKAKPAVAGKSKKFNVDNTAPTISISSPSTGETGNGPVSYEITYGGADTITLTSSDIQLNVTGNDARDITVTPSGPNTRTVTISDIGGNGTLGISLAPGTAEDNAGNMAPAAGPSETFIVTNAGPSLAISAPSTDATNEGPVTYTITYSDADVITLSEADIVLNKTGTATGSVSVSTASATARTVTVSDIGGYYGDMGISVQSGTARDMVGNLAPSAGPSQTFEVYGPPPTLQPGNGFTEPTPQPDPIGEGPGVDAKVIARWDVVPYQTFDGIFEIGVVAFHINGIDTVEFSLEGGPWTPAIPVMTENPRTGVKEYWVKLDASLLPDGPCEIRAIAYPTVGIPRVLEGPMSGGKSGNGEHSIFLSSNANHTLPEIAMYVAQNGSDETGNGSESAPFRSIVKAASAIQMVSPTGTADGGTIRLGPGAYRIGTYSWGASTTDRWLTVEPMPGVAREFVRIVGTDPDGLRTRLVCLQSVTLAPESESDQDILLSNGPLEDYYWANGCDFQGPGRTVNSYWAHGLSGAFYTNCEVSECRDAPTGALVRNARISEIGSDALSGAGLAVNCSVTGIDQTGTSFHADVLQLYSGSQIENRIAYNIFARARVAQGFFAGDAISIKDIAFVNCDVDNTEIVDNIGRVFQFGGPTEHLYVRDCAFVGSAHWRVDYHFTAHNVVLEDTTFNGGFSKPAPGDLDGVTYIHSGFTY